MDLAALLNLDLLNIKSRMFLRCAREMNENSPEIAVILEDDELIMLTLLGLSED